MSDFIDILEDQKKDACIAELERFIDTLYEESGIPTRHWREVLAATRQQIAALPECDK